jgi:hypothetical protein
MRKIVKEFVEEMEKALKKNEYKGGWHPENCDILFLNEELERNIKEWEKDLQGGGPGDTETKRLINTANFCMMLWSRLTNKIKTRKDCL